MHAPLFKNKFYLRYLLKKSYIAFEEINLSNIGIFSFFIQKLQKKLKNELMKMKESFFLAKFVFLAAQAQLSEREN